MAKKDETPYVKNEIYKEVMGKLYDLGYRVTNPENVAFMVDEDNDDVVVDVNFMSSGIHYNKKDVEKIKSDIVSAGFKWCLTWNFNF